MNKLIYFFLVTLLYSCNNSKGNNFIIPLFNQYALEVHPDEKQIPLNQQIQDEYIKNIKDINIQIPLFRAIRGKDYILFIGIPYGLKSESLLDSNNFNKFENVLFANSFHRENNIGNREISQVITQLDNNWISILIVAQNEKNKIDFDTNQLLKRIIKIEK